MNYRGQCEYAFIYACVYLYLYICVCIIVFVEEKMKLDISYIKYSLCYTCIEGLTIFLSSVCIVASIISPDHCELL